ISNLDERILYREITESLIAGLFEKQRCEIKDLIQRVLDEIDRSYINYDISIGLIEKSKYDGTDTFLHPMIDIEYNNITVENIKKSLNNKKPFFLQNIYLKEFYPVVERFKKNDNIFLGSIKTTEKQYNVKF